MTNFEWVATAQAAASDMSLGALPHHPLHCQLMPAQQIEYATPDAPHAPSKLAVLSLVLGCLGLAIPLLGIVALVLGIIVLTKSRGEATRGSRLAVAGICTGGVGIITSVCVASVLLPALLMPSLSRSRETANRVKCASNLRQIGQAMLLYAGENNGSYPLTPDVLLLTDPFDSRAFVCPSTSDTPAALGGSRAAQAAALSQAGHNSYIYCGGGLGYRSPADAILAYELPSNHGGDGGNILYGDRHVEFQSATEMNAIIEELRNGHNPPRSDVPKQGK